MDNVKVVILLATYNGEKYLAEQLESLFIQDFKNIYLLISDDGSSDKTLEIIQQFKKKWGDDKVFIFSGPQKGYAKNFLHLVQSAEKVLKIDENFYFAYADQDDIWYPNKISNALNALSSIHDDLPSLFCTRTRLINEIGEPIGFSPIFTKPPTFKNALLQNIAGGNTMIFNYQTFKLLNHTPFANPIFAHDWWTYLLVTGAQGHVIYSSVASMDYRQHAKNLVGSNIGLMARLYRMKELIKGRFLHWNSDNLTSLTNYANILSPENQQLVEDFLALRKKHFPKNLIQFRRLGLYRQTQFDNLAMQLALIFKRI
jgi:glycosyltransferase involved in cell wall biosynthesis